MSGEQRAWILIAFAWVAAGSFIAGFYFGASR